jgi:hypothetical protein
MIQRTTLTKIGYGMPSEDILHYNLWKKATTCTAWLSVIGVPLIIAAVALGMPRLALVAPAAIAAFVVSKRERDELSKMLKIRFTAAMNLRCGPNDEPYRYSHTEA